MTRYAYITRGAFAGRRAEILDDFGTFAHLAVESGVLNAPENDFIRLTGLHTVHAHAPDTAYHALDYGGISREGYHSKPEAGRPQA